MNSPQAHWIRSEPVFGLLLPRASPAGSPLSAIGQVLQLLAFAEPASLISWLASNRFGPERVEPPSIARLWAGGLLPGRQSLPAPCLSWPTGPAPRSRQ